MNAVWTAGCNVVYKGPTQDIGDLRCERIRPGMIRTTWEPDEHERELLARGGRIQLTILREPISPVKLVVVPKEESEPIGEHGWKVDVEPGDSLREKGEERGKIDEGQDPEAKQEAQGADDGAAPGPTPEANPS